MTPAARTDNERAISAPLWVQLETLVTAVAESPTARRRGQRWPQPTDQALGGASKGPSVCMRSGVVIGSSSAILPLASP